MISLVNGGKNREIQKVSCRVCKVDQHISRLSRLMIILKHRKIIYVNNNPKSLLRALTVGSGLYGDENMMYFKNILIKK